MGAYVARSENICEALLRHGWASLHVVGVLESVTVFYSFLQAQENITVSHEFDAA